MLLLRISVSGGRYKINVNEIKNIESEAGVIASILKKPELTFYSEQLRPNHFSDSSNAYIYYAVCELAKRGISKVDAYNITNILNAKSATKNQTETITIQALNELIELSSEIARSSVEEYKMLVENVLDAAFRRYTYNKLVECESLCFSGEKEIEKKICKELDSIMLGFNSKNEVPEYKDVVDQLWSEIEARQAGGSGIPFPFPTLNQYAQIEPSELFIFGAEQKTGKSIMLLNCAVDLLKKGYSVLYLDSELNSRMFTCRLISHLTGIEYRRVKSGNYTSEEHTRILQCKEWLKQKKFTHLYIPMFDTQSIYTTVRKVYHTQGIDVLIVDYFKGSGEGATAWDGYNELGKMVDMVKNQICGELNIAGVGAAQATSTGKLADSVKIARNASTIAMIQNKTQEEIEADGLECGNKKLKIIYNRNGEQMTDDNYIDLNFNGNLILYEEAKQHCPNLPY